MIYFDKIEITKVIIKNEEKIKITYYDGNGAVCEEVAYYRISEVIRELIDHIDLMANPYMEEFKNAPQI